METKITLLFDAKVRCRSTIAPATIVRLRLALAPLLPAATNASPSTKVIINDVNSVGQAGSSRSCAVNGVSTNGRGFTDDGNRSRLKPGGIELSFSLASPPLTLCICFLMTGWLGQPFQNENGTCKTAMMSYERVQGSCFEDLVGFVSAFLKRGTLVVFQKNNKREK